MDGSSPKPPREAIRCLMQSFGGSFARALGIDLRSRRSSEMFRWLVAAILFGAPIPEKTSAKTFQIFEREGLDLPEKILEKGWEGLVALLDEGGYGRYDFKTATKLLQMAAALKENYEGDLRRLHREAADPRDLEKRIASLARGIGEVTVNIFLRDMRGIWEKAEPLLGDLAVAGARHLGFLSGRILPGPKILQALKALWKTQRPPGMDFTDFEAALVRQGLEERRSRLRARRSDREKKSAS